MSFPIHEVVRILPSVAFVCRQSPDWHSLSQDQRRGARIDPARYLPDHRIPGFPDGVDLLIAEWNRRFAIDFFTFRYAVAELSRRSIVAIPGARVFTFDRLAAVADYAAHHESYVYFHDDDDFFAPNLPQVICSAKTKPDAIVTPLFRLGRDGHSTFVRDQCTPDFLWGRRKPHKFRYQSNNYGLSSRRCTNLADLASLKDHVLASRHADQSGYRDEILPSVVSATVKTPASASMLPILRGGPDCHRAAFEKFIADCQRADELPSSCSWISEPLRVIRRLVSSAYRGEGCDSIGDLLGEERS
jgi:hypothetical protein